MNDHSFSTDRLVLLAVWSCAGGFEDANLFLNVLDPPGQPSVDFFIKCPISVCYIWAKRAAETCSGITRLVQIP